MKKGKDPNTDAGASHMPRVKSDCKKGVATTAAHIIHIARFDCISSTPGNLKV